MELSQRKPLQDLFEVYDTNNDGKVPSADLKKVLMLPKHRFFSMFPELNVFFQSLYHAGIAKPTVKAALKVTDKIAFLCLSQRVTFVQKMDPKDTGSITVDGFHEILNLPTTHVEKALRGTFFEVEWCS